MASKIVVKKPTQKQHIYTIYQTYKLPCIEDLYTKVAMQICPSCVQLAHENCGS